MVDVQTVSIVIASASVVAALFPQQMETSPATPFFFCQQFDSGAGRLAWLESTSIAKSPKVRLHMTVFF
jgi:hypothetical protein